jgi:DNA uptake protein ComE-like DNA-binding protein
LEKYILLPSVDTSTSIQISEEKTPIIVDLNAADTIELKQLKGIGTVFARRIVSYREKLGGYFDKSQLLEVFGMDTARLAQISPYIEVDLQKIKQLHLNKAGYKELLAHPYLENYIVKAIFEYKDKVGKFNSVDELQNISLIYPQLFQKIEHYFTVEDSYTRR